MCLSTRCTGDLLYLWNPLTKRFKQLPVPNIKTVCALVVGFCFDSVSDDYKVLRIVLSDVTAVIETELYSTNANSWKGIQLPETVEKVLPWPYRKCVNTEAGVLYLEKNKELLSFDSRNETFGVYPFPESMMQGKRMSGVLDFNGSAAMIIQSCDVSVLSLWTLDDVCDKVFWVKKFNFEVINGIRWIHLYLGAGQFVSRCSRFDPIYCFHDFKKKKITKFPLSPCYRHVLSVYKFTGSLVSLEGFERLD